MSIGLLKTFAGDLRHIEKVQHEAQAGEMCVCGWFTQVPQLYGIKLGDRDQSR